MKRFFVCGGLLGSEAALEELRRMASERRPDGLLFAGGILAPERSALSRATDKGLVRDDAVFLQQFFATLGELDIFSAVLPGPCDEPLEDFLHLGMNAELDYPNIHLAHANLIALDGLAVCGIGGRLVEEGRSVADEMTHLQANYYLRSLDRSDHPRKILLLPASPLSLGGGVEGRLIDDLIRGHSADLCVVAGPTEHRGVQRSGRTLIVNPGGLADGSAAWVDWRRHPGGHVEFLGEVPASRHKQHPEQEAERMLAAE